MRSAGHPRINCCVPGCRGGTQRIEPLPEGVCCLETGGEPEWICSRHWPRVSRQLKARRRALFRLWRKLARRYKTNCWWELAPGSGPRIRLARLDRLIKAVWVRCKAQAGSGLDGSGAEVEEVPAETIEEELARLGL